MERKLIAELANALARSLQNMLEEGGAVHGNVGQTLDNADSALGRACAYLGQPIPAVVDYADDLQELFA